MLNIYNNKFRVTQLYKPASNPTHIGIDVVGDTKNIYAIRAGTVITSILITDKSNRSWERGNYVVVKSDIDGTWIYYTHMKSRAVQVGDKVSVGTLIGVEGSTGYSTGSHCHLEIRKADGKTPIETTSYIGIKPQLGYAVDNGTVPTPGTPIVTTPPVTTTVTNNSTTQLSIGNIVSIKHNGTDIAKYINNVAVPARVIQTSVSKGYVIDGVKVVNGETRYRLKEIYSWVPAKYIIKK